MYRLHRSMYDLWIQTRMVWPCILPHTTSSRCLPPLLLGTRLSVFPRGSGSPLLASSLSSSFLACAPPPPFGSSVRPNTPLSPPRRSPFLDVQPGGCYKVFPFVICGKFLPSTTDSEIYTQVDAFTGSWIQVNTTEASDDRASFSQTSGPALPCKFEL